MNKRTSSIHNSGHTPGALAHTCLQFPSPLASSQLGTRMLNGATKRCWGQQPSLLGSPTPTVPGPGPGKGHLSPKSPGEHQLWGQLRKENLQKKFPEVSPLPVGPPAASSLSPHQAELLRPGPPDGPSNTAAYPAKPDFLPMSITKKQGLAPAQTARSAASYTSGWKGGPEN